MIVGPILAREILVTPRRVRFYLIRGSYVTLFFVLMWTAWQSVVGFQKIERIGDLAHFSNLLFEVFAYTQLALVLFAAMLTGASSISQEKDRRTFILLLVTRLSDREIVLNKFFCSVLQVTSALLAVLPLFLFAALLGGIGYSRIAEVYAATFGGAVLGAAVGVLMGVWREKTFQAIALTLLFVVLSLLAVEIAAFLVPGISIGPYRVETWCTIASPFRAIAATLDTPGIGRLGPLQTGSSGLLCLGFSLLLTSLFLFVSIWKLRVWNPRGEPIQQSEDEETEIAGDHVRRKKSRRIWDNPVLWREVRTKAYGSRPVLIKVAYCAIFAVLMTGLFLTASTAGDTNVKFVVTRSILPIAILGLLLLNTQAVTAVTSERDIKGIDLLLVTDLSPKEFIYGKLVGIAYNGKEMIVLPILGLIACAVMGLIGLVPMIYTVVVLLVFDLFTIVLGIHAGMRYETTRSALSNSLGTTFLLFVGMLLCLFLILISGRFEAQWASFILFIVVGSIGLWVSLSANAPTGAIGLTAFMMPFATFYCIIAFLMGDQAGPFLVGTGVYGFAVLALLIPLISEFDVATGRTTAGEG